MIGDAAWKDLLWERYQQHRSDAARHEREPQIFEQWAVGAAWRDFVDLARGCQTIPEFCWSMWETHGDVPCVGRHGFGGKTLERRIINDWLMVRQIYKHLKGRSRRAYTAVKTHVERDAVPDGQKAYLHQGKRLIYDWLTLKRECS